MPQEAKIDQDQVRALSLPSLLLMFAFVGPPAVLGGFIKASGAVVLRYCVGITLGVLTGGLIVYLTWNLSRYLLVRLETSSGKVQNWIIAAIFGVYIGAIVVGFTAGIALAKTVTRFIG